MQAGTDFQAQMFADDVRRRERRRQYALPVWQVLSIVLHGLGFICLVLFTPLREIVVPEPKDVKSDPNLTATQYEALAENVQTIRLNELVEQLDSLQIILHNMDMMKNEILKDYDAFADAERDNSREQVKELLSRVVAEQEKALASQAEAEADVETIAKAQSENIADTNTTAKIAAALDAARPVFAAVDAAQANAQHLMDQAAVKAEFAGLSTTAEIASALRDIQLNANTMQREFQVNLQNQVGAVTSHPQTLKRVANLEESVKTTSEQLAETIKTEKEQQRKDAELKREISKGEKQVSTLKATAEKQKAEEKLKSEQVKTAVAAADEARRASAEAEKQRKATESASREATTAAAQAQKAADAAQAKAEKQPDPAEKEAAAKAAESARIAAAARDAKAAEMKQAVDAATKKADELRKADEAVKVAREAEKKAKDATASAEGAVRKGTRALEQKRRDARSVEQALTRTEQQRKRLEEDLPARKDELKQAKTRKTEVEALSRKIPREIPAAQRDTIAAQKALVEKVKELAKLADSEVPDQRPLAKPEFEPDPDSYKNVLTMDIVEAYETARQLEEKITESYREIKSAESAIIRKMSYQAASKLTDVAKVVRIEADSELLRSDVRDRETFDRQKAEATKLIAETDSIVETSTMIMKSAIEITGVKGNEHAQRASREDRLQRMYELSGMSAEMTAAAAESDVEKAKDLSQLMEQAHHGGADSKSMKGGAADREEEARVAARPSPSGLKSPLPGILGGFSSTTVENVPGNIIKFSASANPAMGGVPTQWMYVNSWYVIGPFPNPDRINIRRRFPPETVVDLDATYLGKDNRVVKWKFEQAQSSVARREHQAYVVPSTSEPYGIWYAYTEVFVDQECDVWIAVGSDDRSDLWINDLHVWGSSNELKVWRINEGFRKVHLRQGRNRFLARIENGWHVIGWSVCIALTEDGAL
ncbi:MAG: hypothetical protein ACOX9C_08695 [Kiritimatiellia bacterium]|jgi:hypothetical protein